MFQQRNIMGNRKILGVLMRDRRMTPSQLPMRLGGLPSHSAKASSFRDEIIV
jgi:hypothetical protein